MKETSNHLRTGVCGSDLQQKMKKKKMKKMKMVVSIPHGGAG